MSKEGKDFKAGGEPLGREEGHFWEEGIEEREEEGSPEEMIGGLREVEREEPVSEGGLRVERIRGPAEEERTFREGGRPEGRRRVPWAETRGEEIGGLAERVESEDERPGWSPVEGGRENCVAGESEEGGRGRWEGDVAGVKMGEGRRLFPVRRFGLIRGESLRVGGRPVGVGPGGVLGPPSPTPLLLVASPSSSVSCVCPSL